MTREEAIKLLQVTRLMLMDGANQPISDLYYALDMAIEALEQTEPTVSKMEQVDEPQTYITEGRDTQILDAWQVHHRSTTSVEDESQTDCSWK